MVCASLLLHKLPKDWRALTATELPTWPQICVGTWLCDDKYKQNHPIKEIVMVGCLTTADPLHWTNHIVCWAGLGTWSDSAVQQARWSLLTETCLRDCLGHVSVIEESQAGAPRTWEAWSCMGNACLGQLENAHCSGLTLLPRHKPTDVCHDKAAQIDTVYITATILGNCGMTRGMDICLLGFCGAIKMFMIAQGLW